MDPTPAIAPPLPTVVPAQAPAAPGRAVVAFIQGGDLRVWEEATGQIQTIFDGGDAIDLTLSDDGELIAFLRRTVVELEGHDPITWREQSALWVVDSDGGNPRTLVSTENLRRSLGASESDSTNIPQMRWIPRTHRLLHSGWTYIVQAEGESHATPSGLFLVDADSGANSQLLPTADHLRFSPAPDGRRIALISLTGLSFLDLVSSDRTPELVPIHAWDWRWLSPRASGPKNRATS